MHKCKCEREQQTTTQVKKSAVKYTDVIKVLYLRTLILYLIYKKISFSTYLMILRTSKCNLTERP